MYLHSKRRNAFIQIFSFPGKLEADSWTPVNSGGWAGHKLRSLQMDQHTAHTPCVVSAPEHSPAVQPQLPPPREASPLLVLWRWADFILQELRDWRKDFYWNQSVRSCILIQNTLVETHFLSSLSGTFYQGKHLTSWFTGLLNQIFLIRSLWPLVKSSWVLFPSCPKHTSGGNMMFPKPKSPATETLEIPSLISSL